MESQLLHKSNTGIASELLVAGELARRGYNVTITLGNTKSIDLIIEKDGKLIPVQVKGIQRKKSGNWNVNLIKLKSQLLIYVLVNLNADNLHQPEYFILTEVEVKNHFIATDSERDYLTYNKALQLGFKDRWDKLAEC